MADPLAIRVQSVGKEINLVLARFHAVARHAPSAVTRDGDVQPVPRSVIDSWEAKATQLQRRVDECEHEKEAFVQRSGRERQAVVDAAASHISMIDAKVSRLELGFSSQFAAARCLHHALHDADDELSQQAQQLRMQVEENHALGVELLHTRDLLRVERDQRARAEAARWKLEGEQATTRSQLAAAQTTASKARVCV